MDWLVYFTGFGEIEEAIGFEKHLKRWRRDWKINLIETDNPNWDDLYIQMISNPTTVHPVLMGPGLPLSRKPG